MQTLTTTPFGRRPVTAGLVARAAANRQDADTKVMDKWSLFRELSEARQAFGLGDRALMVLNALLSFHPGKTLEEGAGLIVFPSNRALGDRAHGMAESTLRRHLATLVETGLIARHDSPNGKRYAHRSRAGEVTRAFGFDLRPLLLRTAEIVAQAEASRAAREALKLAREEIVVLKRDALKLALYAQENALPCSLPGDWDAIHATLSTLHSRLRRKLPLSDLQEITRELVDILGQIRAQIEPNTSDLSGSDSETERHYQNSNKDSCESEQLRKSNPVEPASQETPAKPQMSPLPLHMVLEACPDILPYCDRPPRHWRDLVAASGFVRGMMGITPSAWEMAQKTMGPEGAAVTLACILQRFAEIRNPGGYLRKLSQKAELGSFSTAPMVMALLSAKNRVPA